MPMFSISQLLDRFKGKIADRLNVEEQVISVVKEVCGIDLTPQAIKFVGGVVSLSISPAAKQMVYIKKEQLLIAIHARLPSVIVRDVR